MSRDPRALRARRRRRRLRPPPGDRGRRARGAPAMAHAPGLQAPWPAIVTALCSRGDRGERVQCTAMDVAEQRLGDNRPRDRHHRDAPDRCPQRAIREGHPHTTGGARQRVRGAALTPNRRRQDAEQRSGRRPCHMPQLKPVQRHDAEVQRSCRRARRIRRAAGLWRAAARGESRSGVSLRLRAAPGSAAATLPPRQPSSTRHSARGAGGQLNRT